MRVPGSLLTLIDLCQYGPDSQFGPHPPRAHGVLNRNEDMHNAMERNLSTCSPDELMAILSDLDVLRDKVETTMLERMDVYVDCDACHRSGAIQTFQHHEHCPLARSLSSRLFIPSAFKKELPRA